MNKNFLENRYEEVMIMQRILRLQERTKLMRFINFDADYLYFTKLQSQGVKVCVGSYARQSPDNSTSVNC